VSASGLRHADAANTGLTPLARRGKLKALPPVVDPQILSQARTLDAHPLDARTTLDSIKSEVCDTTLVVMSLLVVPAIGVSLLRVLDVGWTVQYLGQVIGAAIAWGITIFRRRLPYQARAITILALLFWLAWTGQVYTPSPTSYVFFVSAAAMAVVFYGAAAGVMAVVLSVIITISTYFAIKAGMFPVPTYATTMSFTTWLSRLASLVIASAGPVIAINQYRQSLMRELKRAEDTSDAKSAFLATMSHELRTPMTAIIGIAELLQEENLGAEQSRKVDRIARAGKNLLSLLNDLLDFAKIEAEQMPINRVAFSVGEVVGEVHGLLAPLAADKGLKVRLENTVTHDALMGDPARLRQILNNLVGNAVKFTESGEISIAVSQTEISPARVMLRMAVADTGIGISPADQARLFQPFVQAQDFRSRTHGGTGLGLAISRRLAAQMNGELTVRSEIGKGATFTVTVPLDISAEGIEPRAEKHEPTQVGRRALEILMAEDNESIRDLMREMLTRRGHHVLTVENGLLALKAVQTGHFDVIIMDMHMPVMDGAEATRAIRALPMPESRIPIVALTAGLTEDQRHAYLVAGVSQIVAKPAHWPTLFEAIETRGFAFRAEQFPHEQGPAAEEVAVVSAVVAPANEICDEALLKGLEEALGAEVMAAAIATFQDNISDYIVKLDAALAAGDLPAARKIGHAIKGTSLQFGALEVGRLGADVELKTASFEEVRRAAAEMPAAFARFNDALASRAR
jgi:signal transduction histidine kinase/FixJ family two-component response regulator/HPt (histidine-containing phosphotransfer) domain-containing protein